MVADELVVLDDGFPVSTDVACRELLRAIGVLVAERPAGADRRRRIRPVHLMVNRTIGVQLLRHLLPGFLRDDQDADAEAGHDLRRLRRDGGSVRATTERLERARAKVAALLLDVLPIELAVTLLETL